MPNRAAQLLSRLVESSPLRHARFRLFYLGNVGTALGYTMQATVAAWLMATLTPSALMVALVQTASTAPALLFGLIAGALADIVDRRRLLLITHVLLLAGSVLLGVAALVGVVGPASLLALTFVPLAWLKGEWTTNVVLLGLALAGYLLALVRLRIITIGEIVKLGQLLRPAPPVETVA